MFRIANPCGKNWGKMAGDERRRFCDDCGKFVHAVEAYSEAELRVLGPICGYVGGETFAPGRSRRAVMAGVVLTTLSPLLAQDGRVRVVVTDAAGAAVNGGVVSVGEWKGKTDALGVVSFGGLPVGRYAVVARSPGFKTWRGTFNVLNGMELPVDARLETGTVGGGELLEPVRSETAGQLQVFVRDATAAALIHADVAVKCAAGILRKARVDGKGMVSLAGLPVGDCQVEVRAPEFKDWRDTYTVKAGSEGRLDVRMDVSDPGRKVNVRPKAIGLRFLDWLSSCART